MEHRHRGGAQRAAGAVQGTATASVHGCLDRPATDAAGANAPSARWPPCQDLSVLLVIPDGMDRSEAAVLVDLLLARLQFKAAMVQQVRARARCLRDVGRTHGGRLPSCPSCCSLGGNLRRVWRRPLQRAGRERGRANGVGRLRGRRHQPAADPVRRTQRRRATRRWAYSSTTRVAHRRHRSAGSRCRTAATT